MDEQRVFEALGRIDGMAGDIAAMKGTMDRVATALERLARVEESQIHFNAAMERMWKEIEKHDERLDEIEKVQPLQKQASDWVGRGILAAIVAVVTVIATWGTNKALQHPAEPTVLAKPAR